MARAQEGMRVTGTIKQVDLHTIPSKLKGVSGTTVARVLLDIEDALDATGNAVDRNNLIGPFEGPADLYNQYSSGERVRVITTTPTGMHIASISRLD